MTKRHVLFGLTVVAVVTVAAVAFAATRSSSKSTVAPATSSSEPTTTTTSTSSTTSTTTTAPVSTTAPPLTEPPVTEPPRTEAPTTTSPKAGAGAEWSMTPSSGPGGTDIHVAGTGCLRDGSAANMVWNVHVFDPSGDMFMTDGGPVHDDGSWRLPSTFGLVGTPPGDYRVTALCVYVRTIEFSYVDKTFTFTD